MNRRIPIEAFEAYVALGAERSYKAIADKYGVSKNAVVKLAERERWQDRLDKVEHEAHQRSEARAVESIEAMNDRHLKITQVIQGKALEALRTMPVESAMDAVRALDLAIRHERVIRGEPSERAAISVEDTLRRQYTRWMTAENSTENDSAESDADAGSDGAIDEPDGEPETKGEVTT